MTDRKSLLTHPGRQSVLDIARDLQETAFTGMHCSLSSQAYRDRCAAEHEAWGIVVELCGGET